jgi:hypothetical protein
MGVQGNRNSGARREGKGEVRGEVVVMASSVDVRAFNFSSVFAEDATQPEVRVRRRVCVEK